jgi:hypothetical protein
MRELATRVRGSLPYSTIDARRVTMAAKNPACSRLRAMVMAGVDPNAVARDVFGIPDNSSQSGFALRQGNAFERAQARQGATRLIEALKEAGVLGENDVRVLDLSELPGLNSPSERIRTRARRQAIIDTERALRSKIQGETTAPNIILQAHLRLPLGDDAEEAIVRPDALIAKTSDPMYRVGEIKSFASIRHLTDEQDVASAAAQSGVYAVTLEATLQRLGYSNRVAPEAVLVFRKPGGFNAEPTLQRIDRDIEAARRMLDQRPRSLQEIAHMLGAGQALDKQANILRLPSNFVGGCRSFCPMWQVCLNEGRHLNAPAVLGNDVEDAIGALGNTQRARELLAGATPANDIERDIQRRLRGFRAELQEATR